MTAREAVEAFRDASRVPISEDTLAAWINELEGNIYYYIILTHEGGGDVTPPDITLTSGYDDTLFAPEPFSKVYADYLAMKRDLTFGDVNKYSISSATFSASYGDFGDWYNRTHAPLCKADNLKTSGGTE
ncbi:MAG: hypothetical protein IJS45_05970 [Clostridia bacterium]|nr:hypothetical protein [Clostridia bacterium]